MKKNLGIWVLVVALVAVAIYFTTRDTNTTLRTEKSDFAVEDTASITKIFLANKADKKVLLERSENGWTVNKKYAVRDDAIKLLLETVKKLKVRNPVPRAAFENITKNIASEHVKVEIYQGDEEPTKVYYIGSPNPKHSGSYALIEGSSMPFVVHVEGFYGFVTPRFFVNENEWRSNSIFSTPIEELKQLTVRYPNEPGKSFEVKKENGDFVLYGFDNGRQVNYFDTLQMYQYLKQYERINFETMLVLEDRKLIDSLISTTPQEIYELTDQSGKTFKIETYKRPAPEGSLGYNGEIIEYDVDRMYGLLNDKELVIIQYFVFDRLKKDVAFFSM